MTAMEGGPSMELTAGDHLEAFLRLSGLTDGHWIVTLDVRGGDVARVVADPQPRKLAWGRAELATLDRRDLGSETL